MLPAPALRDQHLAPSIGWKPQPSQGPALRNAQPSRMLLPCGPQAHQFRCCFQALLVISVAPGGPRSLHLLPGRCPHTNCDGNTEQPVVAKQEVTTDLRLGNGASTGNQCTSPGRHVLYGGRRWDSSGPSERDEPMSRTTGGWTEPACPHTHPTKLSSQENPADPQGQLLPTSVSVDSHSGVRCRRGGAELGRG